MRFRNIDVTFLVLFCFFVFTNAYSAELPDDIRDDMKRALSASDNDDHKTAYKYWVITIKKGTKYFDEKMKDMAIEQLLRSTKHLIEEAADKNDIDKCIEYGLGGVQFGAPNFKEHQLAALCYPHINLMLALCYSQLKKNTKANYYLSVAKKTIGYTGDAEVDEWLKGRLTKVQSMVTAINNQKYQNGEYVTNKGLLQTWIGRVASAKSNKYTVKITYCNSDKGLNNKKLCIYKTGKTYVFFEDEFKPLTTVSTDALIKGYK